MTISFVSQVSAEANTVALGAHASGDLIIAVAFREGVAAIPSPDSTNWSLIFGISNSIRGIGIYWSIARTASETLGTWTNTDLISALVYRETDPDRRVYVGGSGTVRNVANIGAGSVVNYFAVPASPADTFFAAFGSLRANDADLEVPPTGMVNRMSRRGASAAHIVMHDTDGVAQSWPNTTLTLTSGTPSVLGTLVFSLVSLEFPLDAGGGAAFQLVGGGGLVY